MLWFLTEGTVQEFKRTIVLGEGEAGIRLEVPASLNKSLWETYFGLEADGCYIVIARF